MTLYLVGLVLHPWVAPGPGAAVPDAAAERLSINTASIEAVYDDAG